jgi:hypothetical protein
MELEGKDEPLNEADGVPFLVLSAQPAASTNRILESYMKMLEPNMDILYKDYEILWEKLQKARKALRKLEVYKHEESIPTSIQVKFSIELPAMCVDQKRRILEKTKAFELDILNEIVSGRTFVESTLSDDLLNFIDHSMQHSLKPLIDSVSFRSEKVSITAICKSRLSEKTQISKAKLELRLHKQNQREAIKAALALEAKSQALEDPQPLIKSYIDSMMNLKASKPAPKPRGGKPKAKQNNSSAHLNNGSKQAAQSKPKPKPKSKPRPKSKPNPPAKSKAKPTQSVKGNKPGQRQSNQSDSAKNGKQWNKKKTRGKRRD